MNQRLRLASTSFVLLVLTGGSLFLTSCNNSNQPDVSSVNTPAVTNTPAQPPTQETQPNPISLANDGADRPGTDPLALLQNPQVSQELKLSDQQVTKIKQAEDNFRAALNKETANLDLRQVADDPQKQKELEDKLRQQITQTRTEIGQVLQPEQLQRFKEITLQIYGFGVLSYDQFLQELGINDQQEQELNALREKTFNSLRANLQEPAGNDQAAMQEAIAANTKRADQILKESNQAALNVLSDEQKQKLKTLEGEKFAFNPNQVSTRPAN